MWRVAQSMGGDVVVGGLHPLLVAWNMALFPDRKYTYVKLLLASAVPGNMSCKRRRLASGERGYCLVSVQQQAELLSPPSPLHARTHTQARPPMLPMPTPTLGARARTRTQYRVPPRARALRTGVGVPSWSLRFGVAAHCSGLIRAASPPRPPQNCGGRCTACTRSSAGLWMWWP